MRDYVYIVRPLRPGMPNDMTEAEARIIDQHFLYLKNALDSGILVLAGPCEDGAFGIVIFRAEDLKFAKAFMENDPAVKHHVMSSELHPFRISLREGRKM